MKRKMTFKEYLAQEWNTIKLNSIDVFMLLYVFLFFYFMWYGRI